MSDFCSAAVLHRARELGATLVGLTGVEQVERAPSARDTRFRWPSGARAVLVLGLAHPAHEPELDWWGGPGSTPGNRVLQRVSEELRRWLSQELDLASWVLPYHVERGGIFLKDAAVLAGLGVLGANNLVVTPEHGPRIRWRAMLLALSSPGSERLGEQDAPGRPGELSGPEGAPSPRGVFDPCSGCPRPCHSACPQGALSGGGYDRDLCGRQMSLDEARPFEERGSGSLATASSAGGELRLVRYCRECELACPVGRAASQPGSD